MLSPITTNRIIDSQYIAVGPNPQAKFIPGDDVKALQVMDVEELLARRGEVAFDHPDLIEPGLQMVRRAGSVGKDPGGSAWRLLRHTLSEPIHHRNRQEALEQAHYMDGTVLTEESPGPWEVHLKDGRTSRRDDLTKEVFNADGSGRVFIYDHGELKQTIELARNRQFVDGQGRSFRYLTSDDEPLASDIFPFKHSLPVEADLSPAPFSWTDSGGNPKFSTADSVKVTETRPDGSKHDYSMSSKIFLKTYHQREDGLWEKIVPTRAQQLQEDIAVASLEGMNTGLKGDWLATGVADERYVLDNARFPASIQCI